MTLTQLDSSHHVKVTVGQVLEVKLPCNRTTGFDWVERAAPEPVLERVGDGKAPAGDHRTTQN